MLEKGRGKEFRGKSLNEIQLEKEVYYSSESEQDSPEDIVKKNVTTEKVPETQTSNYVSMDIDLSQTSNLNLQNSENTFIDKCLHNEQMDLKKEKVNAHDSKNDNILLVQEKNYQLIEASLIEEDEYRQFKKASSKKTSKNKNESNEDTLKQLKPRPARMRWSMKERKLVTTYFKSHISNKVTPRKHECDEFIEKYGKFLNNKDWVKIKTFVYNCFRLTQ